MTKIAITRSASSPACAAWNACAVPEKLVETDDGSAVRASRCTSFTASPSATPGRRLKDRVTDGSCPAWFTARSDALRHRRHRAQWHERAVVGADVQE